METTEPRSKTHHFSDRSDSQQSNVGLGRERKIAEEAKEESGSLVLRKGKKRRIEWWCGDNEYESECRRDSDSKKKMYRRIGELEEEVKSSGEVNTKIELAGQPPPPSSSAVNRSSSILSATTTVTSSAQTETEMTLHSRKLSSHLAPESNRAVAPLLRPTLRRSIREALSSSHTVLQSNLSFKDYEPYLSQQKIEPLLSFDYHRLQLKFFASIVHHGYWSTRPHSVAFIKTEFGWLHDKLLTTQLDYEKIRNELPLGPSDTYDRGVREYSKLWKSMSTVISRIYDREVSESETYYFLENASTALLNLVRLQGDTIRYGIAVSHARKEFHSFLLSRPLNHLTPYQQRARNLLNWLTTPTRRDQVQPSRWETFWREEVKQNWQGKKSLVLKWMDTSAGWQDVRGLERWEREVCTLRDVS
ncbi:hypothetical protein JCM5350_005919 [Sporobolomyces pararoseus]